MTDFGAENAFAGAAAKLQEHYGIEVPVSAVRVVALSIAPVRGGNRHGSEYGSFLV